MTFFESIKTVFHKYATFEGRATRPEFWWFALFSALVAAALGALNITTTTSGVDGASFFWGNSSDMVGAIGTSTTLYLGTSLASLWSIGVLLPSLAVTIRRLRDAGRDWTNIFWILLPIAGLVVLIVFLSEPTKTEPIAVPPTPAVTA